MPAVWWLPRFPLVTGRDLPLGGRVEAWPRLDAATLATGVVPSLYVYITHISITTVFS